MQHSIMQGATQIDDYFQLIINLVRGGKSQEHKGPHAPE